MDATTVTLTGEEVAQHEEMARAGVANLKLSKWVHELIDDAHKKFKRGASQ